MKSSLAHIKAKKNWAHTPAGKLSSKQAQRKYNQSAHGREVRRRLEQTAKRKAGRLRYNRSTKGRENYRKAQDTYRQTPHGKFMCARKAALRHHQWEITENEYLRIIESPCFYCGGPLPFTGIRLDRMDSSKDYTVDNVVSCCSVCNRAKGNWWSVNETKIAVQAVLQYRRNRVTSGDGLSQCAGTNEA